MQFLHFFKIFVVKSLHNVEATDFHSFLTILTYFIDIVQDHP